MSVRDKDQYFDLIDVTLKELRDHFTYKDVYLGSVLPEHMRNEDPDTQASFLADQILFCLASLEGFPPENLARSRMWLCGVFAFLFDRCRLRDQTFGGAFKLIELDRGTRQYVFVDYMSQDDCLRKDPFCPFNREQLERAVVKLVTDRKAEADRGQLLKKLHIAAKTNYVRLV